MTPDNAYIFKQLEPWYVCEVVTIFLIPKIAYPQVKLDEIGFFLVPF